MEVAVVVAAAVVVVVEDDDEPLLALVAIARALEDSCDDERDEEAAPADWDPAEEALNADCARKAARKFARNGRFVDIVGAGWDI